MALAELSELPELAGARWSALDYSGSVVAQRVDGEGQSGQKLFEDVTVNRDSRRRGSEWAKDGSERKLSVDA